MANPKSQTVRVRAVDHVERITVALITEEVPFAVRPEPNGWWAISATFPFRPGATTHAATHALEQIEQTTRNG